MGSRLGHEKSSEASTSPSRPNRAKYLPATVFGSWMNFAQHRRSHLSK
jgi:hypothetical protein